MCRVGDKPLTAAYIFINTFQKQIDGGYEPSDFTGNIVHTQSRQVIDSALFETLRQFADGAHGFVRNPHSQQYHQRQCRQQGQHALPCRILRQIFTVFVFLHDGNPSLFGRADIGAVIIVVPVRPKRVQTVRQMRGQADNRVFLLRHLYQNTRIAVAFGQSFGFGIRADIQCRLTEQVVLQRFRFVEGFVVGKHTCKHCQRNKHPNQGKADSDLKRMF